MQLTYLLSVVIAIFSPASAQTVAVPKTPGLTFLYSLNCTLGESLPVGNVPEGNRVVIPITGGTFAGPRIAGTSLPNFSPDAKSNLTTPRQSPQSRRRLGSHR